MTSVFEKTILAELWLIHAEQMSLYNFIILKKKQWTQTKTKQLKQGILNQQGSIGFPRCYQKNVKFVWTHSLVSSLPSRNQNLPIQVKTRKNTYQNFLYLSSFIGLLNFVPNILSRIVAVTFVYFSKIFYLIDKREFMQIRISTKKITSKVSFTVVSLIPYQKCV